MYNNFILVNRRRRHYNKKRDLNKNAITRSIATQDCEVDPNLLLCTLNKTLIEVRDTSFTKFVLNRLTEILTVLNCDGISEIICYGLGRFSQYRSSKYQLALLLCLKEQYNARVYVYDPAFCSEETQILRTLHLEIIETNEEGKRVVQDKTTLVYMPHCSRQLINNFLYANWGNGLNNCILFTNSFSEIVDSCLHRDISNTAGYILRIQPHVTEIQLDNSFVYEEVFNDLNIHIFTEQDLLKVPSDFWSFREEPQYTDEVEFIAAARATCNNIMNGNIKIVRSLAHQLRRIAQNKSTKENAMLQYIMEQAHIHRETSQVLCKAREELKSLAEMYLCYLRSQQMCKEIHKQYAGKGERSIKETADLVGFKLPHDPK